MFRKLMAPLAVLLTMTSLVPSAMAESKVSLRTFYMNRNFDGNTEDREALTQAFRLDHEARILDSITLGASLFANAKITENDDSKNTGLLDPETGEGYAKLGQIYGQYDFKDILSLRAGRWVMDTPLLNDSDSRGTPSSTQAVKLSGHYNVLNGYVIYSDRASGKTNEKFKKYTDANGDDYELVIAGGDMKLDNGLSFAAAYGDADGYATQTYLNAAYTYNDKAGINVMHYIGEGEGAHKDFDADMSNVQLFYKFPQLKLSTGFQTVSGDSSYDYEWGGEDNNGLQVCNSVQIMDFNRQDEDSYQLRADYTVEAIPGLKAMVRHTMGEYTEGNKTNLDEAETDAELSYTLSKTFLKGANFRVRYAHVDADNYDNINEIRFIVNYTL